MRLHSIHGGTEAELAAKSYNIGIGVSLGNKWFTPENIVAATKWALPHTREYVIVYVADTIHAINLQVRSGMTEERALRVARRYGQELIEAVKKQAEASFSAEERAKIFYAVWDDVVSPEYKESVKWLYGLYTTNAVFRERIYGIVRGWLAKDPRTFSEEEVHKLGTYLLEELPEVVARVPIAGRIYDAYTYPFDGELTQFIEKLQQGEEFPQIKEKILTTSPKVFLEVR